MRVRGIRSLVLWLLTGTKEASCVNFDILAMADAVMLGGLLLL